MMVEKTIPVTALKRKIRIAPSILGGDQGNLAGALEIAVAGKADQIHLDKHEGGRSGTNHAAMGLRALPELGIQVNLDKDSLERMSKLHSRIASHEVDPALE